MNSKLKHPQVSNEKYYYYYLNIEYGNEYLCLIVYLQVKHLESVQCFNYFESIV